MKFIDADKRVIQQRDVQILQRIAKRGMGADQDCGAACEKVDELLAQPTFLKTWSAKIVSIADFPVCKETEWFEFRIVEGTSDGLFGNGHNDTLDALML